MANNDNPNGLQFLTMDGPGMPLYHPYTAPSTYATAFYPGDAVAELGTGYISIPATPGTTLITGVNGNYGAASVARTQYVLDSPNALFHCQDNNDTDGFAFADRGLNCNLEYTAGNATRLTSGHELDESTATTTDTLDVHLIELLVAPDNAYGANGRWVIKINRHRYAHSTAGV